MHADKGKGKGVCLESKYPPKFSGLYINYPQMLELTVSQSHIPGDNAAQFSASEAIYTVSIFRSTWYPLLLSDQTVWIQNVPKAFIRDQCYGNRTPDLLISGLMP